MTDTTPERRNDSIPEPTTAAGLRLRLWLACLGGVLVAAGGIWWVIGTQTGPQSVDLAAIVTWLGAVAGVAVIVGAGFALWLDRAIVTQARGLTKAIATQQIAELRGLPGSSGWGELSQLTQQVQAMMGRHRHAARAAEDLGLLRDQLTMLREALDRWAEAEQWRTLRSEAGPAAPVIDALNRGLRRLDEVREQNLEAARQIAVEMDHALENAREAAEQAERGFVESTALLTTVRELQRLGQELSQATPVAGAGTQEATVAVRAREAIEELVSGSAATVERLVGGLAKVDEIGDQVTVLANRATLIALDSAVGGVAEVDRREEARRLALEVRTLVARITGLKRELESDVQSAAAEMRAVRERVAGKLERMGQTQVSARPGDESARLLERVREMVQDATRKGERLSSTGERTSRAAESLLRSLEAETRDLAGLLARLAPVAGAPESESVQPPAAPPPGLRLLGPDDVVAEPPSEHRAPDAGEEPR